MNSKYKFIGTLLLSASILLPMAAKADKVEESGAMTQSSIMNNTHTGDIDAIRLELEALFRDSQQDALVAGVTRAKTSELEAKIMALPGSPVSPDKMELWKLLTKVKSFVYAEEEVDTLFTDKSDSQLEGGVTNETIDFVLENVNSLLPEESTWKTEQHLRINHAKDLLNAIPEHENEKLAKEKVDGLFRDTNYDALVSGITLDQILNAKEFVDALKDGTVKENLAHLIERASLFLSVKEEVDTLSQDGNDLVLPATLTQDKIDRVKKNVDDLMESTWKTEQAQRVSNIQLLMDQALEEEQQAKHAVEALFRDAKQDYLAQGVTRNDIETVSTQLRKLISKPGTIDRKELMETLTVASLFMGSKEEVDSLFTDSTDSQLASEVTLEDIVQSKEFATNYLKDGAWKTEQLARIQKAEDLWNK